MWYNAETKVTLLEKETSIGKETPFSAGPIPDGCHLILLEPTGTKCFCA